MKNSRLHSKKKQVSTNVDLENIINGCKKNDRVSQHNLYKLFYSKMMVTCLRYSNSSEDAQDTLQDGFMKVFANIEKYDFSGSFEGWLRRIFTNLAIDKLRKDKTNKVFADSELIDQSEDDLWDDTQMSDGFQFKPEEVMREIQNLTPKYKMVFNLYVIEGYSHQEIAKILGISEGTSKSNLSKAKQNIKSQLLKQQKANG